jgi:hypothetical protein
MSGERWPRSDRCPGISCKTPGALDPITAPPRPSAGIAIDPKASPSLDDPPSGSGLASCPGIGECAAPGPRRWWEQCAVRRRTWCRIRTLHLSEQNSRRKRLLDPLHSNGVVFPSRDAVGAGGPVGYTSTTHAELARLERAVHVTFSTQLRCVQI